jgi:hypothetical protein
MTRPVVTSLCSIVLAAVLGSLLHAAEAHAQESLPASVARHEQEIQELRKRLDALESTLGPATGPEVQATDRPTAKATQSSGECFERAMEATGQYQLQMGELWKPKDFLPSIKITRFGTKSVTFFSDNSNIHQKTLEIDEVIKIVHQDCPYTFRLVELWAPVGVVFSFE